MTRREPATIRGIRAGSAAPVEAGQPSTGTPCGLNVRRVETQAGKESLLLAARESDPPAFSFLPPHHS
jgi:hypothetical protein